MIILTLFILCWGVHLFIVNSFLNDLSSMTNKEHLESKQILSKSESLLTLVVVSFFIYIVFLGVPFVGSLILENELSLFQAICLLFFVISFNFLILYKKIRKLYDCFNP